MTLPKKMKQGLCASLAFMAVAAAAEFPSFPLAEEVLAQKGIPPEKAKEIVKKIAGTNAVRVLEKDDFLKLQQGLQDESAAALKKNDIKTSERYKEIAGTVGELIEATKLPNGHQLTADTLSPHETNEKFNKKFLPAELLKGLSPEHQKQVGAECIIRLNQDINVRELMSINYTHIPVSYIEKDVISKSDMFFITLAHELAHCHPKNNLDPDMREVNADLEAVRHLTDFNVAADAGKNLSYLRMLHFVLTNYSSGMAIDAQLNGKPVPTLDTLVDVFAEIKELNRSRLQDVDLRSLRRRPPVFSSVKFFDVLLRDPPPNLTPLTRRFMEITLEAAHAIMPEETKYVLEAKLSGPAPLAERIPRR